MKRLILLLTIIAFFSVSIHADVLIDKAMSKISHDTRIYISGEYRAATEQEAYDGALELLSSRISQYMEEKYGGFPDAVYLTEMSSMYQRLETRISENRYRVMLYVKKSDLKPLGNSTNAVVLAKNDDDTYHVIPTNVPQTIIVRDTVTVVDAVEVPIAPPVSVLMQHRTRKSLTSALTKMVEDKHIESAAKFPLSRLSDFYVAIIDSSDQVLLIAHVVDGIWVNLANGTEFDPIDYKDCSAYWFTLH